MHVPNRSHRFTELCLNARTPSLFHLISQDLHFMPGKRYASLNKSSALLCESISVILARGIVPHPIPNCSMNVWRGWYPHVTLPFASEGVPELSRNNATNDVTPLTSLVPVLRAIPRLYELT